MDLIYKIIIIAIVTGAPIAGIIAYYVSIFLEAPAVPEMDEDAWWGPEPVTEDTTITPFEISASDQVMEDIRISLKNLRPFTPPLQGVEQQYGLHPDTLKPVLDYWMNKYDWPAREEYLNQFPQFKTNIQGLNIHYVHVKPDVTSGTIILPILLLHGWPSSIREYYKLIPLLTKPHQPYDFVFEVIAPSLPGYGFSDAAIKPGLGATEMAVIMKNLMQRLGHEKYYIYGGDLGSLVITQLAIIYPQHVLGLYTNFPVPFSKISLMKIAFGSIYPHFFIQKNYVNRMYPLTTRLERFMDESGYVHALATKPDTFGFAINSSPAGLAAFILEKFLILTNENNKRKLDGGLLEYFTYNELLDNVMIYWITQSFTTSARSFAESFNREALDRQIQDIPINMTVPCGVGRFSQEAYYFPNWILESTYANLVHWTDFSTGGHFPALEVPQILGDDMFLAVSKMRAP